MRILFWMGLAALILGIVSLFVAIPRNERDSFKVGGMSMGVETQRSERLPPIVGAVMILGGAGMMIAGKSRS
jgi:hypothetical protein